MVAEKELPTVNVSGIFNPENKEANWNAVAKELGECLHKIGFVYVTGHGISQELVRYLCFQCNGFAVRHHGLEN